MGDVSSASTLEQWLWIGAWVCGGVGTLQLLVVIGLDWKQFLLAHTGILFLAAIYFLLFIIAIQLQ